MLYKKSGGPTKTARSITNSYLRLNYTSLFRVLLHDKIRAEVSCTGTREDKLFEKNRKVLRLAASKKALGVWLEAVDVPISGDLVEKGLTSTHRARWHCYYQHLTAALTDE